MFQGWALVFPWVSVRRVSVLLWVPKMLSKGFSVLRLFTGSTLAFVGVAVLLALVVGCRPEPVASPDSPAATEEVSTAVVPVPSRTPSPALSVVSTSVLSAIVEPTPLPRVTAPTPSSYKSLLPATLTDRFPGMGEEDAEGFLMVFTEDCNNLKALIGADEASGTRTYLEHRIVYKHEMMSWLRDISVIIFTEPEVDEIVSWAWDLCGITDSGLYSPTNPDFTKPEFPQDDPRRELPDSLFLIHGDMTQSKAVEEMTEVLSFCPSSKILHYDHYYHGVYTIEESRVRVREVHMRSVRRESNNEVIVTESQAREFADWFFRVCGISTVEAEDYVPAAQSLPSDVLDSFPLPEHPYFVDELEVLVQDMATSCRFFQDTLDGSNESLLYAEDSIARAAYLDSRTVARSPEEYLTLDEAAVYAEWFTMACGLE